MKQTLKQSLASLGVSQSELARMLPADISNVNRWANGRAPVPLIVQRILCIWLSIPGALDIHKKYMLLAKGGQV